MLRHIFTGFHINLFQKSCLSLVFPSSLSNHLAYFIARQQACIQIAVTIYTQACPRTSLFCFLLYQLSLWWVKYRAQPEAINPWKHASRNAPWQAETSWGEKVKPRKPAWNQAFLWLSICGCQVRNKNFCKKKPYKAFNRFLHQFEPYRAYLLIHNSGA